MNNWSRLSAFLIVSMISVLWLGMVSRIVESSKPNVISTQNDSTNAINPDPPDETVKLVFIHHSCGNNWLDDGNGDLGYELGDNNYYVSDTYYGWGPDDIGSYTDIGHWWLWFRGENSSIYLNALYTTTNQNASYTRPMVDPNGENEVIMFKSCYPNSNLKGDSDEPPTEGDNPLRGLGVESEHHTVGNAKGIYNDLLEYFETRQDKLFVVITAPPVMDTTYSDNARAFNNWLVNDWLNDYPYHNVAIFDFYNVLTTNGGDANTNDYGSPTGNHHRVITSTLPLTIEHITDGDDDDTPNTLEYPTGGGTNNHPSPAGNQKATGEFVPLLNAYYNCWKHGDCGEETDEWLSLTAVSDTVSLYQGETATYDLHLTANEDFTDVVTLSLQDVPPASTHSFSPSSATPPATSLLSVTTTASTAAGVYTMTTVGSSSALTDDVQLTLIVASAGSTSFTLSVSPTIRIARPAQTVSYTVTATGLDNFSRPITLTTMGLITGVGKAWSVNPVTPDSTSVLSLFVPSSPPFGSHPFQIIGTAQTQAVSEDATLVIDYPFKLYLPIILKRG